MIISVFAAAQCLYFSINLSFGNPLATAKPFIAAAPAHIMQNGHWLADLRAFFSYLILFAALEFFLLMDSARSDRCCSAIVTDSTPPLNPPLQARGMSATGRAHARRRR